MNGEQKLIALLVALSIIGPLLVGMTPSPVSKRYDKLCGSIAGRLETAKMLREQAPEREALLAVDIEERVLTQLKTYCKE